MISSRLFGKLDALPKRLPDRITNKHPFTSDRYQGRGIPFIDPWLQATKYSFTWRLVTNLDLHMSVLAMLR